MNEGKKMACRYCGKELYQVDQVYAYDPETRESAKINFYGGFVCSQQCDFNASLELERSMPGHGYSQKKLGCFSSEHYRNNWK